MLNAPQHPQLLYHHYMLCFLHAHSACNEGFSSTAESIHVDRTACTSVQGALSSDALAKLGSLMGSDLSKHVAEVLPVLFRELRCEDPDNQRNAAHCINVFCRHAPQQMQNQTGQLLQVRG